MQYGGNMKRNNNKPIKQPIAEMSQALKQETMLNALLKKAIGYDAQDVVEEFGIDSDGNEQLAKKKVQIKHIPPDTAAAKLLLECLFQSSLQSIERMSDDELEAEKNRLLAQITPTN